MTLINQKYNPSVVAYLTALREFAAQQQKNAADTQAAMAAERMLTVKIAAVAVALLLLAIIVGAYYLIGSIQRPLAQARGLAERIAGGDLSQQESVTRGDEFGDLLRSLYAMSNALGRMVHQVRQSADSIAIASAEIATGNQDLSARTEQTSSNLQIQLQRQRPASALPTLLPRWPRHLLPHRSPRRGARKTRSRPLRQEPRRTGSPSDGCRDRTGHESARTFPFAQLAAGLAGSRQ